MASALNIQIEPDVVHNPESMLFCWTVYFCIFVTGKSFSEELFLTSTNPQYDKRLFIELRVQYMKIASSEHVVYINCSECQNKNKNKIVYTTCSQHVLCLQFSCTELIIQWIICCLTVGIVDEKIKASDKDLPVPRDY